MPRFLMMNPPLTYSLLPWRSDSPVPMSSSLTSKPNWTSEQTPHQIPSATARRLISGGIGIFEVLSWWYRRKLLGLQPQESQQQQNRSFLLMGAPGLPPRPIDLESTLQRDAPRFIEHHGIWEFLSYSFSIWWLLFCSRVNPHPSSSSAFIITLLYRLQGLLLMPVT